MSKERKKKQRTHTRIQKRKEMLHHHRHTMTTKVGRVDSVSPGEGEGKKANDVV